MQVTHKEEWVEMEVVPEDYVGLLAEFGKGSMWIANTLPRKQFIITGFSMKQILDIRDHCNKILDQIARKSIESEEFFKQSDK
jgi:hydroxylamine reductase (hybrid-cluster protein)